MCVYKRVWMRADVFVCASCVRKIVRAFLFVPVVCEQVYVRSSLRAVACVCIC